MILVRLHERAPILTDKGRTRIRFQQSTNCSSPNRKKGVEDRNTHYQNWHAERYQHLITASGCERQRCQGHSEKHASGISQEDRRRIEVVTEKGKTAACKNQIRADINYTILEDQRTCQSQGCDDCQSGCQSIQPVNLVECIDCPDNPEKG